MVPLVFETICEAVYPITEAVANGSLTLLKNWWVGVFLAVFFIPNIGNIHITYKPSQYTKPPECVDIITCTSYKTTSVDVQT